MNKKRSIKNLVFAMAGQVVTILAGLILTRLILISFGSATNGLLTSVNQIFTYFSLLEAGVGTASLQALYRPVAKDDKKEISKILAATKRYYDRTSALYLAGIVIFALIYALLLGGKENGGWIPGSVMVGVIFFSGIGNVVNYKYQGKYKILMQAEGRNYIATNVQTVVQVLVCAAKALGIALGGNIVVVMFLGAVVTAAQSLYYFWYVRRNYQWLDFSETPAKIRQTNAVMVHQISQLVFQNTDVLILTIFCDLKTVSVYSAYKVVVSGLQTVCKNFSESFLFILGQEFAKSKERYCKYVDLFDIAYSMFSFAVFAVAYVMYLPFIELYTKGVTDINYLDPMYPALFIAIELLSGCRRSMQNTINVAGHFQSTLRQTILETTINLVVSLISVARFGMIGVLFGTVAALLYRSNEIIFYGNRKILNRSPWPSYRIYLLDLILFLASAAVSGALDLHFSSYVTFVIAAAAASVVIGAVFAAANLICFRSECRELLAMAGRKNAKG